MTLGQRVAVMRDGRILQVDTPHSLYRAPRATDASIGANAAERTLRVEGDVAAGERPVVIELRPKPLVAAGETGASLGEALRAACPATSVHVLHEGDSADGTLPADRRIVVVLRDAARHRWQQEAAEHLLALRPDAIVVETGVPGWSPSRAAATLHTYGGGRATLEAAARRLAP